MNINPKVIDIYRLDNVSSFGEAYAAGIRGVIHKASEGLADPPREMARYGERRHMAADDGLMWGAYHFMRPSTSAQGSDAIGQAHRFMDLAAPSGDTLLALDHEDPRVPLADAVAFLREVLSESRRRWLKLYSGFLIKEQLARAPAELVEFLRTNTQLWLSEYGPVPKWPTAVWEKPWLWQFTGDGEGPEPHAIPGIQDNMDINSFDGSDEDLAAQWSGG